MCASGDVNQLVLDQPQYCCQDVAETSDSETICIHVHLCTAGAHASRVTVIQIHQWYMSSAKGDLVRMVMLFGLLCGHC